MTNVQFFSMLIAPIGAVVIGLVALYLTRDSGQHPQPGE